MSHGSDLGERRGAPSREPCIRPPGKLSDSHSLFPLSSPLLLFLGFFFCYSEANQQLLQSFFFLLPLAPLSPTTAPGFVQSFPFSGRVVLGSVGSASGVWCVCIDRCGGGWNRMSAERWWCCRGGGDESNLRRREQEGKSISADHPHLFKSGAGLSCVNKPSLPVRFHTAFYFGVFLL